jgi:hypothetical protein
VPCRSWDKSLTSDKFVLLALVQPHNLLVVVFFFLLTLLIDRFPPSSSPLEPLAALQIDVLRIDLNSRRSVRGQEEVFIWQRSGSGQF